MMDVSANFYSNIVQSQNLIVKKGCPLLYQIDRLNPLEYVCEKLDPHADGNRLINSIKNVTITANIKDHNT